MANRDLLIKEVLDENCSRTRINRSMIQNLRTLRVQFATRNQDHLDFFSGSLLGVQRILYLPSDRTLWFDEIIEVDEQDVRKNFNRFKDIEPEWVRVNDTVNVTSAWLIHHLIHNHSLSEKDRDNGIMDIMMLMQYKFITSIINNSFRDFLADPAVATAAYEALTRKFELKEADNWNDLLRRRASRIIEPGTKQFGWVSNFNNNQDIASFIQDLHQGLKEVVKKYFRVYERARQEGLQIDSTSSIVDFDGEMEIIERTRDQTEYVRFVRSSSYERATFIRKELLSIIQETIPTVNLDHLEQCLVFITETQRRDREAVDELISQVLLHVFDYITKTGGATAENKNMAQLLIKLKNIYTAPKMSDPVLVKNKELADKLVAKSVQSRNSASLASVRTALQLYIVLLAFARGYYVNN